MTRTCLDCPAVISKWSKGRCRLCTLAHARNSPEVQAKRLANLRGKLRTPEHRAKASAARIKLNAERRDDPAWIEAQREYGARLQAAFRADPDAQARRLARHAVSMGDRLDWCPPHLRDDYRIARKKIGAADARRLIEAEIPGTAEHGKRVVARCDFTMRLKHEREIGSRY